MDEIVVDVEIQKTIEETPGGWEGTDKLGVAVACVWEYQGRRMRIYGPDDVVVLRERLLAADRIGGFNIYNFDFPVIWAVPKKEWLGEQLVSEEVCDLQQQLLPKTNDILRRIWISLGLDPDKFDPRTHGGWKLDDLVSVLFGVKKIGFGGDAPKWFQAGQWARVANYCADDVALERDLIDFVEHYGYVINPKTGRKLPVTADSGY